MSQSKPSIVVIGGRSNTTYMLINYLSQYFDIPLIIFENSSPRKLLPYRIKKLGYWIVFNQLLFLVWDRIFIRPQSSSKIEALMKDMNTATPPFKSIDVETVNCAEVEELLSDIQPQVIVVSGSGIIRKKILKLAPTFINIHAGITPRYRGVHGGFWAIVEKDYDHIGTTVHLIDPGVDTGSILYQGHIEVDKTDTFRTLPVKQYLVGKDLMRQAVDDAFQSNLQPYTKDDSESTQWFSPTFKDYFKFIRNLRSRF